MKKKSRLLSLVAMAAMMAQSNKYSPDTRPQTKRKRDAKVLPSDKNPVRKKTVFRIKGCDIEAYSRKDALKIYNHNKEYFVNKPQRDFESI